MLKSWLIDIVQEHFCTSDGALDPTFQINNMFVAREIKQNCKKLHDAFFWRHRVTRTFKKNNTKLFGPKSFCTQILWTNFFLTPNFRPQYFLDASASQ